MKSLIRKGFEEGIHYEGRLCAEAGRSSDGEM